MDLVLVKRNGDLVWIQHESEDAPHPAFPIVRLQSPRGLLRTEIQDDRLSSTNLAGEVVTLSFRREASLVARSRTGVSVTPDKSLRTDT